MQYFLYIFQHFTALPPDAAWPQNTITLSSRPEWRDMHFQKQRQRTLTE